MDENQETIPFVNLLTEEQKEYYYKEYLSWLIRYPEIGRKHRFNSVKLHRVKLGPPSFVLTTWQKYYVWDIGTIRLYVANGPGVAMEIKAGTSLSTAWKHFRAYKKKMTTATGKRKALGKNEVA